jgi:hypothetical protein
MLDDQVGATGDGHGTNLRDVGSVFEGARKDGFVEEERLVFELERGDKHVVKRRALGGTGQWG